MPDKIKNIREKLEMEPICFQVPWNRTIPQANNRITMVLTAVARFELTSLIPILARIAVRAAKKAESKAKINQLMNLLYQRLYFRV